VLGSIGVTVEPVCYAASHPQCEAGRAFWPILESMRKGSRRRTLLLAALWALAVGIGCGSSARGTGPGEPTSSARREPNELGAFNFTIESRPVAAQVDLLASTGYKGVTLEYAGGQLEQYRADPGMVAGRLRVIAVLFSVDTDQGIDPAVVRTTTAAVLAAGALPCLRMSSQRAADPERLAGIVRTVSDIVSSQVPSGALVLYPHAGEPMDDAEAALDVMSRAGRPNVRLSLHLVHELKAGNQGRLGEVIRRVSPHLALASINGADVEREAGLNDYSRSIRPLAAGDLDVESLYLRPLLATGYTGPVILHTFGLREPPEEHYPSSMARWRQMMAAFFGPD
jgi:sugar phosphate isomerase/epimerase